MERKTALFSGLSVLAILIVFYGIVSLAFSVLTRFGLPSQAQIIVFGLLMFVLVIILEDVSERMNDFEFIEHAKRQLLKNNLSLQADVSEALLIGYLLEEGEAKKEARKEIDELIAINTSRSLFSRKPSFYVPPLANGAIRIGRVVQGEREGSDYCINAVDLQHLGIFAATYSGKTTLLATILTQLDKLQKPITWLAFDFKRDLRSLSRNYDVKVLRWNRLKLNPLQPPPNVPLSQWMAFLADIMAHVFGWFHASENYLMQFMQRAYDAKSAGYPSFRMLHDLVVTNEEGGTESFRVS